MRDTSVTQVRMHELRWEPRVLHRYLIPRQWGAPGQSHRQGDRLHIVLNHKGGSTRKSTRPLKWGEATGSTQTPRETRTSCGGEKRGLPMLGSRGAVWRTLAWRMLRCQVWEPGSERRRAR